MQIRDIIRAKKFPNPVATKEVVGKHKFNGNYDADKFKKVPKKAEAE